MVRFCLALVLLAAAGLAGTSRVDQAIDLQKKGKFKQARATLQDALPELRASGDRQLLAGALSAAGQLAVSLGDYHAALRDAGEAAGLHEALRDDAGLAPDFNTLGLAHLYLGHYPEALDYYQQALQLDRKHGNRQGEVARLNNIGNVYYFQGRYLDAMRTYEAALEKVQAATVESWYGRRLQLTLANLATLYQRLGKEQTALQFYRELGHEPRAMPAQERAQLLLNEGVLYRRMGDPIKALELYRSSQELFRTEHHADGEIGALRNTGIARAVDLGDLAGALEAFTAALELAQKASNHRGSVQARLYRAEVLRRLQRPEEGGADARDALAGAQKSGLVEEQWKALYALGRIAEDSGHAQAAGDYYGKAIGIIESMRSGLRLTSLKTEFLADKDAVYDAMISLRLREPNVAAKDVFGWIERSRARTLEDRLGVAAPQPDVGAVAARLAPDSILLDYWIGEQTSAVLWITASDAGLVRLPAAASGRLHQLAAHFQQALLAPGRSWRECAGKLGSALLTGIPLRARVIVVPDGPANAVPFEILTVPGRSQLLLEAGAVSYLPAARMLERQEFTPGRRWIAPWHRELVAFGDPPVSAEDTLGGQEKWQRLAGSANEVRSIARILGGRADVHLGADTRKSYLLEGRARGVPVLHFSTHGVADLENPERSRMLLAPEAGAAAADYLFEKEVYSLDLKGVELVTLSACDTARGRFVAGEGLEAFSRAFLAAGARSTVTSLWRVADQPAGDFMQQFYYGLARGQAKGEALRSAKLRFLSSQSELAHPRYWAAFVLNGEASHSCPRPVPTGMWLLGGGAMLGVVYLGLRGRHRI